MIPERETVTQLPEQLEERLRRLEFLYGELVAGHGWTHEISERDEYRPAVMNQGTLLARERSTNFEDGLDAVLNTASRRIDVGIAASGVTAAKIADRTRSIWVPISAAVLDIGTPALALVGSGTDKIRAWAFDGTASERITFDEVVLPQDILAASTVIALIHWAPSDGAAGNVKWQFNYAFLDSDDQVDESYTAILATTATPAVADQKTVTTVTATAAKASGDVSVKVAIARLAADAEDTYNGVDAWLTGLELRYTADS